MSRRNNNDVFGGLLLMLFIVAFPIMILISLIAKLSKVRIKTTTNNQKTYINKTRPTPKPKNSSHFKWLDGESDELEIDEAMEIEELLDDDEFF